MGRRKVTGKKGSEAAIYARVSLGGPGEEKLGPSDF
jgi:hypothetical protein